jgi:hypothetical protein
LKILINNSSESALILTNIWLNINFILIKDLKMKKMIRNLFVLMSVSLVLFGCSESDIISTVSSNENSEETTLLSQLSREEIQSQLESGELKRVPFDPEAAGSLDFEKRSRAAAAPLSQMYVYAVGSSDYGDWEYDLYGASSTLYNHGGSLLHVSTVEIGYASPVTRIAKMNGTTLDYDTLFNLVDQYNMIVGFQYVWNASGANNGNFTYTARSTNSPWNTMSTSIYIQ